MFDLAQHLRQWRRETEATLAFSSDELDELEDHLRAGFEHGSKDGLTPGDAWNGALKELGPASALALEFAKDKLMPAMGRLLYSWWQPVVLLVLMSGVFYCMSYSDKSWGPTLFWSVVGTSFLTTFFLIPRMAMRNAILVGMGNVFCLIPLLHFAGYNSAGDKIVGANWNGMATAFGGWTLVISGVGLILINAWGWRTMRTTREKIPDMMTVVGMLMLLLALAPFVSGLIGNLTLRELYHLPTAQELTLMGDARTQFLQWKFVAVLVESMAYVYTWIPLTLAALICVGSLVIRWGMRGVKISGSAGENIFPAVIDLPWTITLLTSGICWVIARFMEPPLHRQLLQCEKEISLPDASFGGLEMAVLFLAALFLVCVVELTRRLYNSARTRPFYASLLIVVEAVVFFGVTISPSLMPGHTWLGIPHDPSAQPAWLTLLIGGVLILGMVWQGRLIREKARAGAVELSLWKYEGRDLLQIGLAIGVSLAGAGTILVSVALVMAEISVVYISALIAWGNSIEKPLTEHFDPRKYVTSEHDQFWYMSAFAYVALCLAIGLGVAIILSAFEFIRFNSFRLYKMRKMKRALAETLAVNE